MLAAQATPTDRAVEGIAPADPKLTLFRRCFLFSDLDPDLLRRVVASATERRLKVGTTLFQMGDEADGLYIVQSGLIRIWINDEGGNELTMALLDEGDAFGEIALLDGLPRSANASAAAPTSLVRVSRDSIVELLETEPRLCRHFLELLCERLRRNTDEMGSTAFLDLGSRLAAKLAELAIRLGHLDGGSARIEKVSQTELAQMLGVTREAVNRQLRCLVDQSLLQVERGSVLITDLDALTRKGRLWRDQYRSHD
ncbi:MAG: Crp/Fnr family transcriptional regulator [Pseudomonadota bacterium]